MHGRLDLRARIGGNEGGKLCGKGSVGRNFEFRFAVVTLDGDLPSFPLIET
jgi:hypothetical protein